MYYNRKKQILKSGFIITFILLIAVIATNRIYYKFQKERNVDYSSTSLAITFHEKSGNKVTLEKVTPVTDSVGLSSKSYTFTVKNNLTAKTHFKISLINDKITTKKDDCGEYQIPENIIKVSLKETGQDESIYILSDLESGLLKEKTIKPLTEENFTVKVWTANNTLPNGTQLHYHGLINVEEINKQD